MEIKLCGGSNRSVRGRDYFFLLRLSLRNSWISLAYSFLIFFAFWGKEKVVLRIVEEGAGVLTGAVVGVREGIGFAVDLCQLGAGCTGAVRCAVLAFDDDHAGGATDFVSGVVLGESAVVFADGSPAEFVACEAFPQFSCRNGFLVAAV